MDKQLSQRSIDFITKSLNINFFSVDREGNVIEQNSCLIDAVGSIDNVSSLEGNSWRNSLDVMKSGEVQTLEEEYQGRWYLTIKAPIIEGDKITGVMGLSHDITDKKKAEIAKFNFLRNISHDIRTPLVGITTLSQFLLEDETDECKKSCLEDLVASSQRLSDMLLQVLEAADSINGKPLTTKIESCNIFDLVRDVVDLNAAALKSKHLNMEINCPYAFINIDKDAVHKIILNLVNNAIKFTDSGSIKINVETEPTLKISVNDSGIGIAEDKHAMIFENFTKLKLSGESQGYTGAGTGLYIAQQTAKELGGMITVESSVGKGSKFTYIQKAC